MLQNIYCGILVSFVTSIAFIYVVLASNPVHASSEKSKLSVAMNQIQQLQDYVNKYVEEVDVLRAEKVQLTKTVRRLRSKNKKLKKAGCNVTDVSADEPDETPELELERAEEYFRRETGQLAVELSKLKRDQENMEFQLEKCKKKIQGCKESLMTPPAQQQQSCDAVAAEFQDKLSNCDETVKAVRERCAGDQAQLEVTTKELNSIKKACGNCTEELNDCKSQRDYLDFLKRGYELVVPDLEKEAKEAKDEKQKTEDDAESAFKDAASSRLYLAIFCIFVTIAVSIKLYGLIGGVLRQRQQVAAAAKAQEKLSRKKRK